LNAQRLSRREKAGPWEGPRHVDELTPIRAFLAVARFGSLSGAARHLGIAVSVVSKRLGRLEDRMGLALFERSSRGLRLTEAGERSTRRFQALVSGIEEAVRDGAAPAAGFQGRLRIKVPTTLAMERLGAALMEFQAAHPRVTAELVLVDRAVNPAEEGFDIAFGALPVSFPDVLDLPLYRYPRLLCAAPAYLAARGVPRQPGDLAKHDCLSFRATGETWTFNGPTGPVSVEVRSRLMVNDTQLVHDAALRGLGVAVVARSIAEGSVAGGALVPLLPDYPVPELWVKALVPASRHNLPLVRGLVDLLRRRFADEADAGSC
jgi:DNA-binding transcriptional LysR family regulator